MAETVEISTVGWAKKNIEKPGETLQNIGWFPLPSHPTDLHDAQHQPLIE